MSRSSGVLVLATALAIGASCNGSSGGSDGGGGTTSGTGGQAGAGASGSGGRGTGGAGGDCAACSQLTGVAACSVGISAGTQCSGATPSCCSGVEEFVCVCGNLTCIWEPGCSSGGTGTGGTGGSGSGGNAGGRGGSGGGGQGGAAACLPDGMSCSDWSQCCNRNCNGTCYSQPMVSDRNMKRDFAPVNDDEILKAVDALPISS